MAFSVVRTLWKQGSFHLKRICNYIEVINILYVSPVLQLWRSSIIHRLTDTVPMWRCFSNSKSCSITDGSISGMREYVDLVAFNISTLLTISLHCWKVAIYVEVSNQFSTNLKHEIIFEYMRRWPWWDTEFLHYIEMREKERGGKRENAIPSKYSCLLRDWFANCHDWATEHVPYLKRILLCAPLRSIEESIGGFDRSTTFIGERAMREIERLSFGN